MKKSIKSKRYFIKNIDDLFLKKKEFAALLTVTLTNKQVKEVEQVIYMYNNYNFVIPIKVLVFMLNNGIDDNIQRRLELNALLYGVDSKLNRVIQLGYVKGVEYWKHRKSDIRKGEKNPAFNHGGKLSPWSKNFINYKNLNDAELEEQLAIMYAKNKDTKHANNSYCTTISYYTSRGFTEDEAKQKLSVRQTTFSKEICIAKYGEIDGLQVWQERQDKWQNTLNSKSPEEIDDINRRKIYWNFISDQDKILINKKRADTLRRYPLEELDDVLVYYKKVWFYTNMNFKTFFSKEEQKTRSRAIHLDHIYSIIEGYKNSIPIHIISSVHNLRLISAYENCSKQDRCDITIDALVGLINE